MTEHETGLNFDHLLSRADDYVLQQIVGSEVVRLLRHIDPRLATPAKLRDLLLQLRKPYDLLRDRRTRTLLLDLLSLSDAEELLTYLGESLNGNPYVTLVNLAISKGVGARGAPVFLFRAVGCRRSEQRKKPFYSDSY